MTGHLICAHTWRACAGVLGFGLWNDHQLSEWVLRLCLRYVAGREMQALCGSRLRACVPVSAVTGFWGGGLSVSRMCHAVHVCVAEVAAFSHCNAQNAHQYPDHPCARIGVCVLPQGYGSTFIKQYVMDSGAGGDMNVGEFWADLHWEDGGEQHLPLSVWSWV